jgi:hypothetical protein
VAANACIRTQYAHVVVTGPPSFQVAACPYWTELLDSCVPGTCMCIREAVDVAGERADHSGCARSTDAPRERAGGRAEDALPTSPGRMSPGRCATLLLICFAGEGGSADLLRGTAKSIPPHLSIFRGSGWYEFF